MILFFFCSREWGMAAKNEINSWFCVSFLTCWQSILANLPSELNRRFFATPPHTLSPPQQSAYESAKDRHTWQRQTTGLGTRHCFMFCGDKLQRWDREEFVHLKKHWEKSAEPQPYRETQLCLTSIWQRGIHYTGQTRQRQDKRATLKPGTHTQVGSNLPRDELCRPGHSMRDPRWRRLTKPHVIS